MTQMRVKDLIEILQQVDPNLPIHKRGNVGDFPGIDLDYAGYWIAKGTLMKSKTDRTYTASADDPMWKQIPEKFKKPFDAVIIG